MSSFVFPDTSKLVCLAAEAIYGDADDWMLKMASDLNVRSDTISQWAKARRAPPRGVIEQLSTRLHEKMERAGQLAAQFASALPRMLCPECSGNLKVIQSPNGRTIDCENGHHFIEQAGPPFGPYVEKTFVLAPRFVKRGTVVVGRNPNNLTFQLSRDVLPADHHALVQSLDAFTDRLGLQRGIVGSKGRNLQAVLRDNLVGEHQRELRKWFDNECDRIDSGG